MDFMDAYLNEHGQLCPEKLLYFLKTPTLPANDLKELVTYGSSLISQIMFRPFFALTEDTLFIVKPREGGLEWQERIWIEISIHDIQDFLK